MYLDLHPALLVHQTDPVLVFQEKVRMFDVNKYKNLEMQGYATEDSTATYNGTISVPLASFSLCFRIQVFGRGSYKHTY